MNRWAVFLAQTPPTLQRLIASSQRISLPRGCVPAERLARLRTGLCRPAAVRAVYFALAPAEQQAVQQLRNLPRGLAADDLAARFGPIRPLTELRADRAPRSLSERLLLLGWLLPRPATRNHPTRYLLPPELRAWLPTPLPGADERPLRDDARAVPDAPALRAATAVLVAAAAAPLPLRGDGRPTAAALRTLRPRLAPLVETEADALCAWLLPLLGDLGLLAPHGAAAAPGPGAQRFLAAPPAERLRALVGAWERCPRPDRWLAPLRVNTRGLDWPALRRRLRAWAAALPPDAPAEPGASYALLHAALGPLADAGTHGFCASPRRAPWLPRRAAEVWAAAWSGPLTWLGELHGVDDRRLTSSENPTSQDDCLPLEGGPSPVAEDYQLMSDDSPSRVDAHQLPDAQASPLAGGEGWHSVSEGLIRVPHGAGEADLLTMAPFARFAQGDATGDSYTLSRASVAAASARGSDPARLRAVLIERCGTVPAELEAILTPTGGLRMATQTVLLSDEPADLTVALRRRSARRAVSAQLAPGVALVAPGGEAALARALARDGRIVAPPPPADTPSVAELTPSERAALLLAAAHYRASAPVDAPPGPDETLLGRLRVGLPPALRIATDAAIAALTVSDPPPARITPADEDLGWLPGEPANLGSDSDAAPAACPPLAVVADEDLERSHSAPANPGSDGGTTQMSCPPLAVLLDQLRATLRRRGAVTLRYQGADETAPRERIVRPLRIERHGPWWYLHAYCLLASDERCFRLDRVRELAPADDRSTPGGETKARSVEPARRPAPRRPRSAPRASFFAGPPDPPPGSPLVRVWLDESSDQPVGRLSGDRANAVDSDALNGVGVELIAAHAIGARIDERAQLVPEDGACRQVEMALEDAALHPRAVALEQLHHSGAALVVDDVVADEREHRWETSAAGG